MSIARDAATPVEAREPRLYFDRRIRRELLANEIEHLVEHGEIPRPMVRRAALRIGRSERHVLRSIEQEVLALATEPDEPLLRLPRDFLIDIAVHRGNVAKAHDEWVRAGKTIPAYSTVCRLINETDTALMSVLKDGVEAIDRYIQVGMLEAVHRNDRRSMDEMHIPFLCRTGRGRLVDNLWLHNVFDDNSRVIVNHHCTIGPSNGQLTAAIYARAVRGRHVGGGFIGGASENTATDHGLVYKSKDFARVVRATHSTHWLCKPYTPQWRGKQERAHRTLQGLLSDVVGLLDGPIVHLFEDIVENGRVRHQRIDISNHVRDKRHLPRPEALIEAVDEAVRRYNTGLHSALGASPEEYYTAQSNELRRYPDRLLWHFAIPVGTYSLEKTGVWIDNRRWNSPELATMTNSQVSVRILPGPEPTVMVGDRVGRYAAVATPTQDETEGQRRARKAQNDARKATMREYLRVAHERLASQGLPSEAIEEPLGRGERKQDRTARRVESRIGDASKFLADEKLRGGAA